jgi:F420-dependent oxidoreductase-like protein
MAAERVTIHCAGTVPAVERAAGATTEVSTVLAEFSSGIRNQAPREARRGPPDGPFGTVPVMQLRIFTEPQQGATYDDLLAVAQTAERLGFDGFFRSDHYLVMGGHDGLPGPTDAWVTLGALARETTRIRLGTLVTAATFRWPGPLAVSVAQVDQMSAGRVELGLGAGWFEAEHAASAVPFPPVGERFERFEEQLAIITGMWATPTGETFSFAGRHHQVVDSPGLPKPVQTPGPPIIIGGRGQTRTPRLAATYAAEFNLAFAPITQFAEQRDRVRAACETIDRDPDSLTYSAALVLCCGAGQDEVGRRAAAIGREPAELRQNGAAGSPAEVVETIARWRDAGVGRIYLQVLDLADLDHLELVAAEVAPHFA